MSTSTTISSLDSVLASAQLPALPHTAIALLQLSQQDDKGPREFARPIEADPGLMGQVLKFVNSSYFGFSREIASVQQALTLVGVRAITNFALWNAVFSVVPNPKFGPFDLKSLWQDSLRRAVFARKLGKHLRLADAEDLFAGALLQDMAIPLLVKHLPNDYATLIERRGSGIRLSLLERETFGWDHAQAAGQIARGWKLPESFATLIQHHTLMEELLSEGEKAYSAACVALASLLPCCREGKWCERDWFYDAFKRLSTGGEASLLELLSATDDDTAQFAPMLKLATPKLSLIDLWKSR